MGSRVGQTKSVPRINNHPGQGQQYNIYEPRGGYKTRLNALRTKDEKPSFPPSSQEHVFLPDVHVIPKFHGVYAGEIIGMDEECVYVIGGI